MRFSNWARLFCKTVNHRGTSVVVPRGRSIETTAPSVRTEIEISNARVQVVRPGHLVQHVGVPQVSPRDAFAMDLVTMHLAVFDQQRHRPQDVFKYPTNLFSCGVMNMFTARFSLIREPDMSWLREPVGYGPNAWVITTDDHREPSPQEMTLSPVYNEFGGPGAGKFNLREFLNMADELLHARLEPRSFGFVWPALQCPVPRVEGVPTTRTDVLGTATDVSFYRIKGSFRSIRYIPMTMDFLFNDRALEIDFPHLKPLQKAFAKAFHANHRTWMQEAQGIMIQYLAEEETQLLEVQTNPLCQTQSSPPATAKVYATAPPATVLVVFWGDVSPVMAEWHDLVVECGRRFVPPRGMPRKSAFDMYDADVLDLLRRPGLLLHGGRQAYAVAKRPKIGVPPCLRLLRRDTLMPHGLLCPKDPLDARDFDPNTTVHDVEKKLKLTSAEAYDTMLRLLSHSVLVV